MEDYLLTILGSSVDYFYEAESYPIEGDFSHARYTGSSAGGCPFNAGAVAASKKISVKALDMLGKDDESTAFLISEARRLNMDCENIIIREKVSNGKVIIINTGDKRTMFVVDPIRPHYEVDEKMQDLLNSSKYAYSLLHIINRSFSSIEPLLEAKRHGSRIIIDGTSKYDDPIRVKMLYDLADGLFINKTDYQRLKKHSSEDPKTILFNNNAEFICVTDGSNGTHLYTKDKEYYAESVKNINVKDSTGAGDSFAGTFLACLIKGFEYERALRYASISGAYACTVLGGLGGVASFEALENFAKEHNYDL
ncbi:MAG: carbohydrate kinase family protein [Erysipelotrichaceae bacterium]|nr:carbohydrate kinase family protein [Erysipelotrichaceae bacterium]